jgi:hypothetical protein
MTFAQTIIGTSGDDSIRGANGGALIFGNGGDDTIAGGNGKDCIVGGEGNDRLEGHNGRDVLLGGPGDDTIDGGNGTDTIDGGSGTDSCVGDHGPDLPTGCESELITAPDAAEAPPTAETERQADPLDGAPGSAIASATPGWGTDRETPDVDRAELLEPCPGDAACVVYVVRAGDNLVSIVRFFEVPLTETLELNPWLRDAAYLPVGVELRLPWPDWLAGRPGAEPSTPEQSPSPGAGSPEPPSATDPPTATDAPSDPPPPPPSPDPPTPTPATPTPEPTPAPTDTPAPATDAPTPEPTAEPTPDPSTEAPAAGESMIRAGVTG